jgi:hypothetical protein
MFGDVVEWFLGRAGDRRQYKRRAASFHLWYQPNPERTENLAPGIGTEISPNGLMFIIPEPIPGEEYQLIVRLNEARFAVRVKTVRRDTVEHRGKTWQRYMGEFTGISADNWDRLVRYVNDEPEVDDRRKMQNQEMNKQSDDAYRLLPLTVQKKIVDMLIARGKLEAPHEGQSPLLKLFYGGLVKRPGEKAAHRFHVHSRIHRNGETMAYDTRFLVTEEGEVIVL